MSGEINIHYRGICKHYRRKVVLDGIDIALQRQQCTLLHGANGAGKTTLLRIMAGLERPDRGSIDTGLGEIKWRRCRNALQDRIMYLHQQPYMFDANVGRNVGYALPRGIDSRDRKRRIAEALEWAGLETLSSAPATNLSGGETQRVALARAWLRAPSVLLLDEPTANMDQESRLRTQTLLRRLKEDGMAIVITSHDILQFQTFADRMLLLEQGRLAPMTPEETAGLNNVSAFPIEQLRHQQA